MVKVCRLRRRLNNKIRIRQLAKTAREKMPKDYKSFCLFAAHLMRDAHRYYSEEDIAKMDEEDSHDEECEVAADSSDVKNNC